MSFLALHPRIQLLTVLYRIHLKLPLSPGQRKPFDKNKTMPTSIACTQISHQGGRIKIKPTCSETSVSKPPIQCKQRDAIRLPHPLQTLPSAWPCSCKKGRVWIHHWNDSSRRTRAVTQHTSLNQDCNAWVFHMEDRKAWQRGSSLLMLMRRTFGGEVRRTRLPRPNEFCCARFKVMALGHCCGVVDGVCLSCVLSLETSGS